MALIEITEESQYVQNIGFVGQISMFLDDLSKEHLPDSYHASPSSIRNIRPNNLIRQFWKPCPISQPRSDLEYLINSLLNLLSILARNFEPGSQYKYLVTGLGEPVFIVLFEERKKIVFGIVGYVVEFFGQQQLSLVIFFHTFFSLINVL